MKRVYKKSYLIILAAIIAVCCALAAVFARGAVAHADIDNAELIYWGFGFKPDGSLYGGDYKLILSDDNDNIKDSESFRLYENGSFSSDAVFENAESVPWSEYNQSMESRYPFYLLEIIGDIAPVSTAYWFAWSPCRVLDLSELDTSRLTNMSSMFFACNYLESLDLSGFDTLNIPDMSEMFAGCEKLTTLDLSGFDTSNVTDMSGMFSGCSSLTDISLPDFDIESVDNVTNAEGMLSGLKALETITIDEGMAYIMSKFDTGLGKTLYIDCISFEPADGLYTGLEADTYSTTAAEHVWQTVDRVEPTETEVGYTEYQECSICGETRNKEEIPATGTGTGTGDDPNPTPEHGTGSGSTNSGTNNTNISDKTILIVLSFGVGLVLLMAIFALILAIKKRRVAGRKDDDGFYDPYYGSY